MTLRDWDAAGRTTRSKNYVKKRTEQQDIRDFVIILSCFRYFVFVLLLSIRTAECRPYTLDAASCYLLLSVDGWYLSVRAPALADWSASAAVAGDCIRNVFVTTMFYEFRLRSVAIRQPHQIPQVDELRGVTTCLFLLFVVVIVVVMSVVGHRMRRLVNGD